MYVNTQQFVREVFDYDNLPADERVCLTIKGGDGGWSNFPATPRRLDRFKEGEAAWYVGVSSYATPDETGYFPRDRDHARYAYCIVLDDVGTKAQAPGVVPSWKIETSPGNYQWGYIIEPVDVADPKGEAYYEGCQRALSMAGFTDDGARGTYRVVRVPGSLHRTGFVARVTMWEPVRVWVLSELMDEFGLEPVMERPRRRTEPGGGAVSLDQVDDPVLDWLVAEGHTTGGVGPKFVDVVCPWADEHSDGNVTAGYTPAGYGPKEFDHAFSCFHEHCQGRGKHQFLDWVTGRGGPDPRPATGAVTIRGGAADDAPVLDKLDLPDVVWGAKSPAPRQIPSERNLLWVIERLGVRCRYNVMTGDNELSRPGWGVVAGDKNDRSVYIRLRSELLLLGISNDKHLDDLLERECLRNPYHPMRDWLDGLPGWDGHDRLALLEGTVETDSGLWPVYLRRWLVQVVEAVRGWGQPKQLPHVLVFTGQQGVGKSTWFSRLLPQRFFRGEVELHLNTGSAKDHQVTALAAPVAELAELDSTFKRSDVGALKAFLSRPADNIRLPYARAAIERPRCTVFCGTVNDTAFLVDITGSRRFWPVHVTGLRSDHGLDLGQLWAQVDALWGSGYGYNLSREEAAAAALESEDFAVDSHVAECWKRYFTPALLASPRHEWVEANMSEVAEAIGLSEHEMKSPITRRELNHLMTVQFGKQLRNRAKRYRMLPIQHGSRLPDHLRRHISGVPDQLSGSRDRDN